MSGWRLLRVRMPHGPPRATRRPWWPRRTGARSCMLLGGFGPKESEYGDDLPEDDEFDGDDDDGECCEQK